MYRILVITAVLDKAWGHLKEFPWKDWSPEQVIELLNEIAAAEVVNDEDRNRGKVRDISINQS